MLPLADYPKVPSTNELFQVLLDVSAPECLYATASESFLRQTRELGERIGARIADELKQAGGFTNSGPVPDVMNSGPSTRGLMGAG